MNGISMFQIVDIKSSLMLCLLLVLVSCHNGDQGHKIGALCDENSPCREPYVCEYGRCRPECTLDADCEDGACVSSKIDPKVKVCTLAIESGCKQNGCPKGLHCADDNSCRSGCDKQDDCLRDQECRDHICYNMGGDLDDSGADTIVTDDNGVNGGVSGSDDRRDASRTVTYGKDSGAEMGGDDGPDSTEDNAGTGEIEGTSGGSGEADSSSGGTGGSDGSGRYSDIEEGTMALFHFNGENGSTELIDSSVKGKVAGITGNPQISTAQSKFGGTSLYINGDTNVQTNYVTIGGGTDFSFPGDFTVDFWLYVISCTDTWGGFVTIYNGDPNEATAVGVSWNSEGMSYHFDPYYSSSPSSSVGAPSEKTWHHIAITRAGSIYHAFIDGAKYYEYTSSTETIGGTIIRLTGASPNWDNGDFNGYIDELRIVKGRAAWTADFSPPTAEY